MPESDQITLTLPRDREFHRVAHLVLGGFALRLDLTLETLEDLQLALGAILERAADDDELLTVTMWLRDGALVTQIEPVEVAEELNAEERDGSLSLGRVLRTVVDEFDVDGSTVRLTKRLDG